MVSQKKPQLLKVITQLEYIKSRSDRENRTLEVELAASKEETASLEYDLIEIAELESHTKTAVSSVIQMPWMILMDGNRLSISSLNRSK